MVEAIHNPIFCCSSVRKNRNLVSKKSENVIDNHVWEPCCLGNYVVPQWIGDIVIDTKQSCDQQPGSFTNDPGKSDCLQKVPGGRKTLIFDLNNGI